jgi:hypothetical protein
LGETSQEIIRRRDTLVFRQEAHPSAKWGCRQAHKPRIVKMDAGLFIIRKPFQNDNLRKLKQKVAGFGFRANEGVPFFRQHVT